MKMLPVCSATPSCSSTPQISFNGGFRPYSLYRKDVFESQDVSFLGLHNGTHLQRSYGCCSIGTVNNPLSTLRAGGLKFVENPAGSYEEGITEVTAQSIQSTDTKFGTLEPNTLKSSQIPISSDINYDPLPSSKPIKEDFLSGVNKSFNASLSKGESAVKDSLDTVNSSISTLTKSANEAVNNAVSGVFSTFNQAGELVNSRLNSFSNDLKGTSSKAANTSIEALRYTIVAVENSLAKVGSFVVYSYGTVKEVLPPEIKSVLSESEESAVRILKPVGMALQQAYITIEDVEKSLGLDPSDPLIPFVLFLGASSTLWYSYWVWTYSGYAGDLSPQETLELLTGTEDAVLIDVRPEVLREKDGIPDLRRGARSRYASVTLPEVDGSIRKLLKGGSDLEDSLIAAVIRNLKIVKDSSKVIIMDADSNCSKSIARTLRKFGVKKPYLIQGGFGSWMKQGLRIKELKPETALTILNEDTEAILESINPSPLQVFGYALGLAAASYALLEWEKTLQVIAIIGLGQTIFRRLASYEKAEDLRQDVRLLLVPFGLGAQAFSWAAGKLETNRIGLSTSPSSSDVQNRVLQAAAKHESQPSDPAPVQDRSPKSTTIAVSKNADLSEA